LGGIPDTGGMEVAGIGIRYWEFCLSKTTMENPGHNREARLTALDVLLGKLDPERDRAAEKYEELRRKLTKFFEWSSCFPAEDLADETLDRVAWILVHRAVLDLEPFLWGVAKKIRQENYKRADRILAITELPNHGAFLKNAADVEEEVHAGRQGELQARCLRDCMQRLKEPNRKLFLRYHGLYGNSKEQREELAAELGLTIGALRVRINRIRSQLEKCVQQCLASGSKKPLDNESKP
jgi:DNA-directed RNA polymerase specialized sigma24 family protein